MTRAQGTKLWVLAGAIALMGSLACDPTAPGDVPDADVHAPDGAPSDADANQTTGGLRVEWACDPMPVAQVNAKVKLSEVRFWLRDLRAIGDSAPGDSRTSLSSLERYWRLDGAPGAINFPDAPMGIYSRLEFKAQGAGDSDAFRIRGEVILPGTSTPLPFEIKDEFATSWGLPLDLELEAGKPGTLRVTFDATKVFAVIKWDNVEVEGGKVEIDDDSNQIAAIRLAIWSSFSVKTVR